MVGEGFVFSISVHNGGDVPLVSVPVVDTFDTNSLSYTGSTPAGVAAGNTVTWNVGPMAAGAGTNLTVMFLGANSTMPGYGTNVVVTTPTVLPTYPTPTPATNEVTYQVQILSGSVYKIR